MKIWISIGLAAVLLFYSWNFATSRHGDQKVIYEPSNKECFIEGDAGKYCIHKAKQGTNGGLIYFLHGRNLDEHTWNDDTFYTALIQKNWTDSNRKPPTIVTVSFGPIWLLAKRGAAEKSGLLDIFVNQTLPKIERRLGFVPTYRGIMGESMGGLNSLIAGLTYPSLFNRIAALCPAVYKISPFDPFTTIWEEIKLTGAEPRTIAGIIMLAKDYASNSSEWDSINPLFLMKTVSLEFKNSIYLSSPLYDRYGLYAGGELLASVAKARGVALSWQPLYGNHCAVDVSSVAEFLL